MKKQLLTLTTLAIISFSNLVNAQAPNWAWAKSAGGSDLDEVRSITTDVAGNLIVAGSFESPSITFGSTILTNVGLGSDMFILKYDSSGNVIWAKSFGGSNDDYAYSVASDASKNIIVAGFFRSDSITFGAITLTSSGPYDIFIVKYDPSGTVLWAKSAGGSDVDYANSVTSDSSGNLIVTGYYVSSTITFDTTTLTNAGGGLADMFVVKYDAAGTMLWAKSAGGNGMDVGNSVTADVSGGVVVAGYFDSSTLTFDSTTLSNVGYTDIFIVKYDLAGTILWVKSVGDIYGDVIYSITTDVSGNLIVTGSYSSPTITFGTTTLTNSGSNDMFIVKYDSSGTVLWAKSSGENDDDIAKSVTTDSQGNIIVAGNFRSLYITFGSTLLVNGNSGHDDIFLVKYDSTGTIQWAKSAGGNAYDIATSVTSDAAGNVIVAGYFKSPTISFGSIPLTNAGNNDIFIAKLDTAMTTGIESTQSTNEFSIYPNPANDVLTISNLQLAIGKAVTISISDIAGKVIYNKTSTATEKMEVNTKDFAAGVYLVHVQTTDFVETRKVIVGR